MITQTNIHNSIQKHLSQLSVPVFHYFNIELSRSFIEKGETIVVWQAGDIYKGEKNHPRFKVLVNILCKASPEAHISINSALDELLEIMKPMLGFDIVDPTNTVIGKFVIIDYVSVMEIVDNDNIVNKPISFEIGYVQTL